MLGEVTAVDGGAIPGRDLRKWNRAYLIDFVDGGCCGLAASVED